MYDCLMPLLLRKDLKTWAAIWGFLPSSFEHSVAAPGHLIETMGVPHCLSVAQPPVVLVTTCEPFLIVL